MTEQKVGETWTIKKSLWLWALPVRYYVPDTWKNYSILLFHAF